MNIDLGLDGVEAAIEALDDLEDDVETITTYTVGTAVEYALYLEFGTSKMDAKPFFRPALNEIRAQGVEGFIAHNTKTSVSALGDIDSVLRALALALDLELGAIRAGDRATAAIQRLLHPESRALRRGGIRGRVELVLVLHALPADAAFERDLGPPVAQFLRHALVGRAEAGAGGAQGRVVEIGVCKRVAEGFGGGGRGAAQADSGRAAEGEGACKKPGTRGAASHLGCPVSVRAKAGGSSDVNVHMGSCHHKG
jgi:hypothetical protein